MKANTGNPFSLRNFVKCLAIDHQQWKDEALLFGRDFSSYAWDDVRDWFPIDDQEK